jgi:hypothetical protein
MSGTSGYPEEGDFELKGREKNSEREGCGEEECPAGKKVTGAARRQRGAVDELPGKSGAALARCTTEGRTARQEKEKRKRKRTLKN